MQTNTSTELGAGDHSTWEQQRFMIVMLVVALTATAGMVIGSETLSIASVATGVVVLGLLALPWWSTPWALVILVLAGRYEFGLASGVFDIAFWVGVSLLITLVFPPAHWRGKLKWTRPSTFFLLGFMMVIAISVLPTWGVEYGIEKAFRVLIYAPLFFIAGQVCLGAPKSLERFFLYFIAFIDLFALTSVAIALSQSGISGLLRIAPPGGGPVTLARLTGFAAIACIGLAIYHPRRRLLLFNMSVLVIVTFMTGSRAPALFLCFMILLVPVATALNDRTRRQAIFFVALIVVGALFLIPAYNLALNHGVPFAERFALLTADEQGTSVTAREEFFLIAIQFVNQSIIAGHGIGSWPLLYLGEDQRAYPHNIFLEIWVEQGLLGLVLFVGLIAMSAVPLWRALRSRNTSPQMAGLVVSVGFCMVFALMVAQTSGDLYDNRYIWFFSGLSATIGGISTYSEKEVALRQHPV